MPFLLESLSCTSWLVYATRSRDDAAARTRTLILNIKKDIRDRHTGRPTVELVIARVLERAGAAAAKAFDGDPMLVPVPGAGLTKANTIWPARRICQELVRHGLGADVLEIVRRTTAVDKSAGAERRPTYAEHYQSFSVTPKLTLPSRIVLVDDVVTSGTTLLACAQRLAEAHPGIPVSAFGIARTLSTGDPIRVLDILTERVVRRGDRCVRGV